VESFGLRWYGKIRRDVGENQVRWR